MSPRQDSDPEPFRLTESGDQGVDPSSRVVYIDNDPIVLAHGRAMLEENDNTAVIQADMRDTEGIFDHPEVRRLIDLDQPVAALFVSVLHCIPDSSDPAGCSPRVAERLPPGSFLVVCQLVSEDKATRDFVTDFMAPAPRATGAGCARSTRSRGTSTAWKSWSPAWWRSQRWRPDPERGTATTHAGVDRVRRSRPQAVAT